MMLVVIANSTTDIRDVLDNCAVENERRVCVLSVDTPDTCDVSSISNHLEQITTIEADDLVLVPASVSPLRSMPVLFRSLFALHLSGDLEKREDVIIVTPLDDEVYRNGVFKMKSWLFVSKHENDREVLVMKPLGIRILSYYILSQGVDRRVRRVFAGILKLRHRYLGF